MTGDQAGDDVVQGRKQDLTLALETLAETTRSERLRRRLSHRQAAEQMGVAYADLCRFEGGKKDPRLTTVIRITRWLEGRHG